MLLRVLFQKSAGVLPANPFLAVGALIEARVGKRFFDTEPDF
jgi:hypothetical protein